MEKRKSLLSCLFASVLVVAFASTGFCFGDNKFEKEVEKEKGAVKLLREVERGDYKIMTTAELMEVTKKEKDFLIVDTMPFKESYAKNHIPGAKQFLFPIKEMTEWNTKETGDKSQEDFQKFLGSDKERKIIIYCGFVKCTRSHNGAMWAKKLGYTNVYRHPGGIFAWKGAGYPVDKVE